MPLDHIIKVNQRQINI